MTQEEKNVEIAKMLGWEELNWDSPPKCKVWNPDMHHPHAFTPQDELEFHSDANWQFEALDWLEQQGYLFTIDGHFIGLQAYKDRKMSYWAYINTHNDVEILSTDYLPTRKEAIFEALYQFSQYIKDKK